MSSLGSQDEASVDSDESIIDSSSLVQSISSNTALKEAKDVSPMNYKLANANAMLRRSSSDKSILMRQIDSALHTPASAAGRRKSSIVAAVPVQDSIQSPSILKLSSITDTSEVDSVSHASSEGEEYTLRDVSKDELSVLPSLKESDHFLLEHVNTSESPLGSPFSKDLSHLHESLQSSQYYHSTPPQDSSISTSAEGTPSWMNEKDFPDTVAIDANEDIAQLSMMQSSPLDSHSKILIVADEDEENDRSKRASTISQSEHISSSPSYDSLAKLTTSYLHQNSASASADSSQRKSKETIHNHQYSNVPTHNDALSKGSKLPADGSVDAPSKRSQIFKSVSGLSRIFSSSSKQPALSEQPLSIPAQGSPNYPGVPTQSFPHPRRGQSQSLPSRPKTLVGITANTAPNEKHLFRDQLIKAIHGKEKGRGNRGGLADEQDSLLFEALPDQHKNWVESRAKINHRSIFEEISMLRRERSKVPDFITKVSQLRYDSESESLYEDAYNTLKQADEIVSLYPNHKALCTEYPKWNDRKISPFANRMEAVLLWKNSYDALQGLSSSIRIWLESDIATLEKEEIGKMMLCCTKAISDLKACILRIEKKVDILKEIGLHTHKQMISEVQSKLLALIERILSRMNQILSRYFRFDRDKPIHAKTLIPQVKDVLLFGDSVYRSFYIPYNFDTSSFKAGFKVLFESYLDVLRAWHQSGSKTSTSFSDRFLDEWKFCEQYKFDFINARQLYSGRFLQLAGFLLDDADQVISKAENESFTEGDAASLRATSITIDVAKLHISKSLSFFHTMHRLTSLCSPFEVSDVVSIVEFMLEAKYILLKTPTNAEANCYIFASPTTATGSNVEKNLCQFLNAYAEFASHSSLGQHIIILRSDLEESDRFSQIIQKFKALELLAPSLNIPVPYFDYGAVVSSSCQAVRTESRKLRSALGESAAMSCFTLPYMEESRARISQYYKKAYSLVERACADVLAKMIPFENSATLSSHMFKITIKYFKAATDALRDLMAVDCESPIPLQGFIMKFLQRFFQSLEKIVGFKSSVATGFSRPWIFSSLPPLIRIARKITDSLFSHGQQGEQLIEHMEYVKNMTVSLAQILNEFMDYFLSLNAHQNSIRVQDMIQDILVMARELLSDCFSNHMLESDYERIREMAERVILTKKQIDLQPLVEDDDDVSYHNDGESQSRKGSASQVLQSSKLPVQEAPKTRKSSWQLQFPRFQKNTFVDPREARESKLRQAGVLGKVVGLRKSVEVVDADNIFKTENVIKEILESHKVVLVTTGTNVIRRTFDRCQRLKTCLSDARMEFDEIDLDCRPELRGGFQTRIATSQLDLPLVFIQAKLWKSGQDIEALLGADMLLSRLTASLASLVSSTYGPSWSCKWEINPADITMQYRIGIGAFGEVTKGQWCGTDVAVKRLIDQNISDTLLQSFRKEVDLLSNMRHPNIVHFLGACTQPGDLIIITEFMSNGNLYQILHKSNTNLSWLKRVRFAMDTARGMYYLHTRTPPIIHMDLKTPNLLVDSKGVVKVCDFGLSKVRVHSYISIGCSLGSPKWTAPEVFKGEKIDEKSDVYSFGVILWELMTRLEPWGNLFPAQVVGVVGYQNRVLSLPSKCAAICCGELGTRCEDSESRQPIERTGIDSSVDLTSFSGSHDAKWCNIMLDCWKSASLRPSFRELLQRLQSYESGIVPSTPRA